MVKKTSRRDFMRIAGTSAAALGLTAVTGLPIVNAQPKRSYGVSLAAWSLHKAVGNREGQIPMLDMPKIAKEEFGIDAIELVSGMMASKEEAYLDQLAKNAADNGVKILLIMVDGQPAIGGDAERVREKSVTSHCEWIDAAKHLGCHSIRMNWSGAAKDVCDRPDELKDFIERSVAPLRKLCDYGESKGINVLIENHGGASSQPDALIQLMESVGHDRFGTLPDFGNFPEGIDKYEATDRMMKYAKAVSAKCYDFDDTTGDETKLDYAKLIEIVADKHGYKGYIGIEYEGDRLGEYDGVKACKKLLDKLRG